jgi:hypothetical protein
MSTPKFYECGICEHYHSVNFDGDCRDDAQRLTMEALDSEYGWDGWVEVDQEDLEDEDYEDGMSDAEADADTLRSAGWGTDEDYNPAIEDDFYEHFNERDLGDGD